MCVLLGKGVNIMWVSHLRKLFFSRFAVAELRVKPFFDFFPFLTFLDGPFLKLGFE